MQGIAQMSAGCWLPAMLLVHFALLGCAGSVPVVTTSSAETATASSGSSTTGSDSTTPPPVSPPATPGTATLTWAAPTFNTDGSTLTDLAGYHIYYGTSATQWSQEVVLDGTATTSYVINGLGTGTYYFAVTAFSSVGTESAQSNLASKTF